MPLSHYLSPLSVAVIAALSASNLYAASCPEGTANCKIYDGDGEGLNGYDFGYFDGDSVSKNQVIVTSGNGLVGRIRGAASDDSAQTTLSDNVVIVDLSSTDELRATSKFAHDAYYGGFIVGAYVGKEDTTTSERNLTDNSVTLSGAVDSSSPENKPVISGGPVSGAFVTYLQEGRSGSQTLNFKNNGVILENVRYECDHSEIYPENNISGAIIGLGFDEGTISAIENYVDIANSSVDANNIVGAQVVPSVDQAASVDIQATKNRVTISKSEVVINAAQKNQGSSVIGDISALQMSAGNASSNTVEISDSTLTFEQNSGSSNLAAVRRINNTSDATSSGDSTSNGVKLRNTKVTVQDQNPDADEFNLHGAEVVNGNAEKNYVEITGNSSLNSEGNLNILAVQYRKVNKSDDSVSHALSDNYVLIQGADAENKIDISGRITNIAAVYASDNFCYGYANLSGNTVQIENAKIEAADKTYVSAINGVESSGNGDATNNKVTIANSEINVDDIAAAEIRNSAGSATNNTVHIGEGVLSAGRDRLVLRNLFGGHVGSISMSAETEFNQAFSGNTLSLASRVETGVLQGFQHYQFQFSSDIFNTSSVPYVKVTGADGVLLHKDEDINKSSTVTLSGVTNFQKGQEVVLIDSVHGFKETDGTLYQEGSLDWLKRDFTSTSLVSLVRTQTTFVSAEDYQIGIENNEDGWGQSLVVVWEKDPSNPDQPEPGTDPDEPEKPGTKPDDSVNDQTDTLVESSLSALATAFAADDLFVDTVLRSRDGKRDGVFAAARAGKYSYDTNTRLETNIVSGLVGVSASVGESNVGAFLEMGHASYDSRLHSAFGDVRGQGSHNYAGIGIFTDYALPVEGWRLTAYVKGGSLNNDFSAHISGVDAGYDTDSAYWGAHLGTHYDFDVASFRTRLFLSYFYDGRESESYNIAGTADVGGAHIKYDSLNAHRVQAGGMFEYKMSDTLRPYLGLTFEQIISAEAEGTATDALGTMKLNSSDLEGSTGILSAGWTYVNEPGTFSCEFGLNGYAGTRNGVSGQIQGTWKF